MNRYLKYFAIFVGVVFIFEALFLLHAWIDAYSFSKIENGGIITIWAAVLTVVFLVFYVMVLLNIDNRIKELNDTRERLSTMEREMKEEIQKFKLSAEEERKKLVKRAQDEVVKIMNKSAERQNTFDQLTQIACNPDPVARINQYTEVLKKKMPTMVLTSALFVVRELKPIRECLEMRMHYAILSMPLR